MSETHKDKDIRLANQANIIRKLDRKLEQKDARIADLKTMLSARDSRLIELEQEAVTEAEHAGKMVTEMDSLRHEAGQRQQTITSLHAKINRRDHELERLEQRRRDHRALAVKSVDLLGLLVLGADDGSGLERQLEHVRTTIERII